MNVSFYLLWRDRITGSQVIEEKNRMGKTRDPVKEIRDTKGTFHAKMSSIKDRNGMDLTEAEEVARIHRRTVQKRSS